MSYDFIQQLMQGTPMEDAPMQPQAVQAPAPQAQVQPQQVGQALAGAAGMGQSNDPMDAISKRLVLLQTQGLNQQKKGIADLEKRLKSYAKSDGPDITPLLALADMTTGSNYMKYVETPKQKKEKALAYEQQIQKARQGVTQSEIGLLKSQYDMMKKSKGKAPSESQFITAGYGRRMEQAEDAFKKLGDEGYSRATKTQGFASSLLPGAAKSDELKRQEQAERNFVNATLRRESGAAIAPSEFESAEQQYFPRAGDTPEVLAQKAANRQQVVESFRAASGNAWEGVRKVSPTSSKDGDTRNHGGVTYRRQGDMWVEVE